MHLQAFHIALPLVVSDGQSQKRHQHGTPVGDVAVKKVHWVGNLHHAFGLVNFVHQGVHAFGEVVGGANFDIGAGG